MARIIVIIPDRETKAILMKAAESRRKAIAAEDARRQEIIDSYAWEQAVRVVELKKLIEFYKFLGHDISDLACDLAEAKANAKAYKNRIKEQTRSCFRNKEADVSVRFYADETREEFDLCFEFLPAEAEKAVAEDEAEDTKNFSFEYDKVVNNLNRALKAEHNRYRCSKKDAIKSEIEELKNWRNANIELFNLSNEIKQLISSANNAERNFNSEALAEIAAEIAALKAAKAAKPKSAFEAELEEIRKMLF